MTKKELSRVDEAIRYTKDWMHFLESCGWDTVEMGSYFYDKLYDCLELLIRYAEEKKEEPEPIPVYTVYVDGETYGIYNGYR